MPDRPTAAARRPAADVLFWDPVHAWRPLLAEFLGTLLLVIYGDVGHLGATLPHLGSGTALVTEIILTAALLLVILGTTAAGPRLVGHNSALAVGDKQAAADAAAQAAA